MTEAHMNGPSNPGRYIDTIDPDDPEYIRQMRRPAEIKEDVKQMEARKRVSLILDSQAFREELEHIVNEQIQKGPHPASLLALQQLTELVLPQSPATQQSRFNKPSSQIIPINDIRGVDSLNYSKGEKLLRCKLASTFRLVDLMGWASGLDGHITLRINQSHEHFLVQPTGLMYHECTAASLLKVDMQGEVLDPGSSSLGLNKDGFLMHAAIHAFRPDIKAIIHLQSASAISVSAMKCGVLPLGKDGMIIGDVSYYDFEGTPTEQEDKDNMTRAMGPINKVFVLRNNGIFACGETLEEAFLFAKHTMAAVEAQIKIAPVGLDNIHLPSDEARRKVHEEAMNAHLVLSGDGAGDSAEHRRKWRRGESNFEALMRHLDNMGFRTGYIFREPFMRAEPRRDRANADIEVPPSATSFSHFGEDGHRTPMKHGEMQKRLYKTDWLATPNAYKKEEVEETGTTTPKKYTKWVGSSNEGASPIKIDSPNAFAPQGANPKELLEKHKSIRSDYYTERVHAGPQSKILEGMTWEEAQRIKETQLHESPSLDGHVSGANDSVIVIGAASKGIIQKDHQHNQVMYKTYYASNPFDNMTETEIEKYKDDIQRRGGEHEQLEPGPDGKLISTEERMQQVRHHTEEIGQQVYPKRQYLETSLDDLTEVESRLSSQPKKEQAVPAVQETSIDDVMDEPPSSPQPAAPPSPGSPVDPPAEFKRTQSARYPPQSPELVQELQQNFERSKSERKPKKKSAADTGVNGDQGAVSSPAKSSSSGDFDRSSKEGSPTKEVPASQESPSKGEKKKKKKFRMPSFSKKKDKKEKE